MKIKLNKQIVLLISLFVFVTLGIFLPKIGWDIGYKWYQEDLEDNNSWKSLGSPPARIEHLLAVRTATVYIQTVDKKIFSYYRESQYDYNGQNEVDAVPPDNGIGDCPNSIKGMPAEPSGVVERLIIHDCFDSPVYSGDNVFAYVWLSDGRVMQWISDPISIGPPPNQFKQWTKKVLGGYLISFAISVVVAGSLFWALSKKLNTIHDN